MRSAGAAAVIRFHAEKGGNPSLSTRIGEYITESSTTRPAPRQEVANDLVKQILLLPTVRKHRLFETARLISHLRLNYPICIKINPRDFRKDDIRVTIERRVIPEVVHREKAKVPAGSRKSIARFLLGFNRRAATLLEAFRKFTGVTSSVLTHELSNSVRAESYHLEVRGPEGYYAARQQFVNTVGLKLDSAEVKAQLVEHSPLRGQRHTHLYLRRVADTQPVSFQAIFHERTPGSMAIALAAAASTFAIAMILAFIQVRDARAFCATTFPHSVSNCLGSHAAIVTDNGSLIQILLTFPIALLAVSLPRSSSVWGGVLVARFANVCVILLALAALALSSFATVLTTTGLSVAWLVVIGLLAIILVGSLVSWVQRTLVHISYVRSDE
ncbi:MAG TPA: hypothetical protein VNT53_00645 [Pseudolysinimonas sp.]|nr:hypothetical protein [Pseudolysinimonas sp.]